jgi:hypothetical protein
MIKIAYLFWTFLLAVLTTGFSYFFVRYDQEGILHGYPLWFYKNLTPTIGGGNQALSQGISSRVDLMDLNYFLFAVDVVFWWLIFSILLVILVNYVFDGN